MRETPKFRRYSLATLLLTISIVSLPLAVWRSGAILSSLCLLYAALVFPLLWDVCRQKVAELEDQSQPVRDSVHDR